MADSKVFKAGDKLVDGSQPFVCQVMDNQRDIRCHYCLNLCDSLKKCGQCGQVQYCSKACQTADWEDIHKHNECKLLKKFSVCSSGDLDMNFRRLIRLVCKVTFDPQSRQRLYPLWDGSQRKIEDLISNEDKVLPDPNKAGAQYDMEDFINLALCQHLINHLDELFAVKLTNNEMRRWWAMLKINCKEVGDAFSTGNYIRYASALYIDGSALKHDCRPSCDLSFNGRQLQVRAMRTIDLSVEEPTISYINWQKDREYRRKSLSEHYFFECQCRRCAEHTDRDFDFNRYQYLLHNQKDLSVDYWEEVIAMDRALVGPHHPNITIGLFMKFRSIRRSLLNAPSRPLLEKWYALANEVKQELEITHGVDHPYYDKLMVTLREADTMYARMRF